MQVVLVMFRDGNERRSFSLTRDITIIGRREDCDFRIPLGEISRKHCRLIKAGALRIEDLGSSNGTYVNGVRVQESELQPGDTLKLGSIVFVVQIDGVPAEDEMQPAVATHAAADSASGGSATIDEDSSADDQLQPATISHAASHKRDAKTSGVNASVTKAAGAEEFAAGAVGAEASGDESFIITNDAPADSAAGEYDPMSILNENPDDSAAGNLASDDISDDILMDLEAQDHPSST